MRRLSALPLTIALTACGSTEPPSEQVEARERPAPSEQVSPPASEKSAPEFRFSIIATTDGTFADVTQIEIRRAGVEQPIQVLDGIEARPPLIDGAAVVEQLDMNFDGYADLRLIEFVAAGGNHAYLNWLFDPSMMNFVRAPSLDAIPSASFDTNTSEIHSSWRDGANRYGSDTYIWQEGEPSIVRRESRTYFRPGMYELSREEFDGQQWQLIDKQTVAE